MSECLKLSFTFFCREVPHFNNVPLISFLLCCSFIDADRRSVSTMNLSKHTDPVITKRLSSSSATLLHSPDRGNEITINNIIHYIIHFAIVCLCPSSILCYLCLLYARLFISALLTAHCCFLLISQCNFGGW